MPEKPAKQSAPARIKRCRELAADALARAEHAATPEIRRSYVQLAQGWTALAAQIERLARKRD